jgi:hypothetical protein
LFTLLIAQPAPRALPVGRAQLLAEAVRATVGQWELGRLPETSPSPGISAKQLLDGYSEIAHVLIDEPAGCPAEMVSRTRRGDADGPLGAGAGRSQRTGP